MLYDAPCVRKPIEQCTSRCVGAIVELAKIDERGVDLIAGSTVTRYDIDFHQLHRVFGECAGFVDAHGVDTRETFDGGQLVNQHATPPQTHHTKGKRDGGHEDKPLGDHGHQRGDHRQQRIVEIIASDKELSIDC